MAPDWVLDAVIVHELAHLVEHHHNARFRQLENRYPRRREADLFLDGYALGLHMPDAGDDEDPGESDDVAAPSIESPTLDDGVAAAY